MFDGAWAAPVKPVRFPQEASDIKPDAKQIYGRLPSGLTYIVQHNATPAKTASIYLRVNVGSMMERPSERGLAHFIEHMAFNGSTHIKEGELKRILERRGFAFGADANAYTTPSKTVYTLDAPKADEETLDTALFIMREVADQSTLSQAAINRERGVILAEERSRDLPLVHKALAFERQLFDGQLYASNASPIGDTDVIAHATRAQLVDFYEKWYRPDQATLIIVGDFDARTMVAKIEKRFGDWHAKHEAPDEPNWGSYRPKGLQTFTFAEKGVTEQLSLTYVRPLDTRPDSQARRTEWLEDYVVRELFTRRLRAVAQESGSSVVAAGVDAYSPYHTARVLTVWVVPKPGKAKAAFTSVYGALKTFRNDGLSDQEMGMVKGLVSLADVSDDETRTTRDNSVIADGLLDGLDSDQVTEGAKDQRLLIDTSALHMTREAMNARIKAQLDGDGPILGHIGEDISDYGAVAMKADYLGLTAQATQAYKDVERKAWPYTRFGAPKAPVSHTTDKDLGFEHYVFANGVVLNLKTTTFKAGQVRVAVDFEGGLLSVDPAKKTPFYVLGAPLITSGGLGKLSSAELQGSLAGRSISMTAAFSSDLVQLSGKAASSELPLQMSLLAAFATDASLDPAPFEAAKTFVPEQLRAIRAQPTGVLALDIASILLSADPRFDPHGLEHLNDLNYADIQTFIHNALDKSPITVTIVGDVEPGRAVAEVARTFGALPDRPTKAMLYPGADKINFPPKVKDHTLYHLGRSDQSVSLIVWPTTDYWAKPDDWARIVVLRDVLKGRLFDEIRERQGAAYSPTAMATADDNYKGYGYFGVYSALKADGDASFSASVERIAESLKTRPLTADELLRVKRPLLDALDNSQKDNDYWLNLLSRIGSDPRQAAVAQTYRSELEHVTAEDLMRLAKTYMRAEAAIHVKVVPQPVQAAKSAAEGAKP